MPIECLVKSPEKNQPTILAKLVSPFTRRFRSKNAETNCTWGEGNGMCNGCPHAARHTGLNAARLAMQYGTTAQIKQIERSDPSIHQIQVELAADQKTEKSPITLGVREGVPFVQFRLRKNN